MKFKGRYVEDTNEAVFIYGTEDITVRLVIPNQTKEEAKKWMHDKHLPEAQVEIVIV